MEMLTKEMVGDEDITKAEEPKYDYSDENLTNLPPRVLEGYLAEKYGTDRYVRERSSVFEEASQNKISDRESILTGPELEALSLVFEEQIKQMRAKAKGGVAEQMEMFQEGGLKDEGGTVDPVSGNEVPPGSTQEEVRDDIPAQLSEGEFVFPADVVRYLGLEFLMKLRQRAKAGLQKMEEMGQMGNSDEATLPDDIPFTVDDLDMREETEEEMEMYQGGAVKAQAGMYVAPSIAPVRAGTTTATQPFMTQPAVAQTNMAFQQPPVAQVNPNLTFANFLGPSAGGAPETEIRRYEHPDGRVRNITVVKATGLPLIPGELDKAKADGFDFKPEALKEEVKVEPIKQQTSRVQSTLSDGDDPEDPKGAVDLAGDPLSYKNPFEMDALDKTLSKIGSFQLAILDPRAAIGSRLYSDIASKKPENIQMKLGAFVPAYKDIKERLNIKGVNVVTLNQEDRDRISREMEQISDSIDIYTEDKTTKETIEELNKLAEQYNVKQINTRSNINVSRQIGQTFIAIDKAQKQEIQDYRQRMAEDPSLPAKSDQTLTSLGYDFGAGITDAQIEDRSTSGISDSVGQFNYESEADDPDSGVTGQDFSQDAFDDPLMKQGGLAKKKKPKVKRMKKGGLASKK